MNKAEFLRILNQSLNGISETDRKEIMFDYEEHFRLGIENNKSEEEIAKALGDAKEIAKQFKADCKIKVAENDTSFGNVARAVLATVGMGFFNLVFVVGPFFGLVGALIGLFGGAIGCIVGGIGIFIGTLLAPLIPTLAYVDISTPLAIFLSIGVTCFGILFFILDCYIAKYFYRGTIKYLKWNLSIIKK